MAKPTGPHCWRCGLRPGERGPAGPCPRCGAPPESPAPRRLGAAAGLLALARGLVFVHRHPRLWGFILAPLLLNAIVFALVAWGTFEWVMGVLPALQEPWPGWIDWLRVGIDAVLPFLMGLVAVVAAFVTSLLVASIVNAPFYDLLSEKIELIVLARPDLERSWATFVADIGHSVLAALHVAARQAVAMGLLFVLSFTAVGAPLFVVAGFYFTGFALADVTLARKMYPARGRVAWAHRHLPLLIGLGLPISFVPLLAPFGIAGATLAFLEDTGK